MPREHKGYYKSEGDPILTNTAFCVDDDSLLSELELAAHGGFEKEWKGRHSTSAGQHGDSIGLTSTETTGLCGCG